MIRSHFGFKKTKKKLDDYSDFNEQVMSWVKEMTDYDKRSELMIYHIQNISGGSLEDTLEKASKIDEYKKYIEETWGEYIPSLKQQIRDKKIDMLLS